MSRSSVIREEQSAVINITPLFIKCSAPVSASLESHSYLTRLFFFEDVWKCEIYFLLMHQDVKRLYKHCLWRMTSCCLLQILKTSLWPFFSCWEKTPKPSSGRRTKYEGTTAPLWAFQSVDENLHRSDRHTSLRPRLCDVSDQKVASNLKMFF